MSPRFVWVRFSSLRLSILSAGGSDCLPSAFVEDRSGFVNADTWIQTCFPLLLPLVMLSISFLRFTFESEEEEEKGSERGKRESVLMLLY